MNPETHGSPDSRGATLVEMLVGIGLLAIVSVIFGSVYRSMSKGATGVISTADMQTRLKSLDQQLHSDLARAGFGLEGISVFSRMQAKETQFNYRDLLGTHCPKGEMASILYAQAGRKVERTITCNDAKLLENAEGLQRDSLDIAFRYLDNSGKATADSRQVKTVEYTLRILSLDNHGLKQRATTGSVNLANN
ncbi:MAG: hypothetical protein JWP91_1508 [Fibrobacteres bacterium]|nr:hypothetical protein [Fibrobacterota bacterium]